VLAEDVFERLHHHLVRIYGEEVAGPTTPRLLELMELFQPPGRTAGAVPDPGLFDETDVWLIAYGDHVTEPAQAPLGTLRDFLARHADGAVTGLHLLPHYPATSDDGFAVADFAAVEPALGEWSHVEALAADHRLMLDAVFNHTSASHPWFTGWLDDDPRFRDFYLDVDPATDLASVVRPRTSPLLTPFESTTGTRHVWTTFSADQVDLNYANPEVLLAVTAELLRYLAHGARMIRLDAIAFLWKEPGTSCIHLPQTHEIIRLWRTVVDAVAPGTLLVTETNVPHRENVTYFGSGEDEAHLVYQFALPPLTLATFRSGDARIFADWAAGLETPSTRTTFLNFLASHDGIGVRPVEGILDDAEIADLCEGVRRAGGEVSYRTRPDGSQSPYELNAVYLDALAGSGPEDESREVDRFVAAHSVLLSLAGVPLLYLNSLFGSRSWTEGVDRTGRARTINRQRFGRAEIEAELADPSSLRRKVLDRLLHRIRIRTAEPAFHPNAAQTVLDGGPSTLALQRTPTDGGPPVLCVHEVSGRPCRFRTRTADPLPPGAALVDLGDGSEHRVEVDGTVDVDLPAYGVRWLKPAG
jgi:glucosylglycerate phosphorylase